MGVGWVLIVVVDVLCDDVFVDFVVNVVNGVIDFVLCGGDKCVMSDYVLIENF